MTASHGGNDGKIETEEPAERELDQSERPVDDVPVITKLRLWIICVGLCLGNFVVALDTSIIATAIPRITDEFHSIDDIAWYGSGYLITLTSLQPAFGKVYKNFNPKWTYIVSIVLFEVGSVICAAAPNSSSFIGGRALAGIGAGGILQGALGTINLIVPLEQRSFYIALVASMFGVSACFGPVLGGALTDSSVGWRMCFWINLPFGAISIGTNVLFFNIPRRANAAKMSLKQKLKQMDFLGIVFIVGAVTCALLALQWGGVKFAWRSSTVVGLFVGFALLVLGFVALQVWLGDVATIPPRIVKQRTVLGGALYFAFAEFVVFAHSYYLPIFFQSIQGVSATVSGTRNLPYVIMTIVGAIISGGAVVKIGYYVPFMYVGAALGLAGAALLHTLTTASGQAQWAGYQILCGIGIGLGFQLPFAAIPVVLSPEDVPLGNAIILFLGQFGGAIGIAITQTIFTSIFIHDFPSEIRDFSAAQILNVGPTNFRGLVPAGPERDGVVRTYQHALAAAFVGPVVAMGLCFLTTFAVEWRSVKRTTTRSERETTEEVQSTQQ